APDRVCCHQGSPGSGLSHRPLRIGVQSGFFPMASSYRALQAGAMNSTESQTQSNIDAETSDESSSQTQSGPGSKSDHLGASRAGWSPAQQVLRRPVDDRMLAGVASGIARYLGVDVNLVRITFVVLAFLGGAALPLYVAGWLLIPEEGSDQSIAG